jgi:uncharacterized Zn finger protein
VTDWEWYPPSRPRRVEGGIKARSKRGAIGEQWWSRRFIEVLESFGMSGRLTRGRSYARAGQVLDFVLTTGVVTAKVQGSRPRPYKVRIQVLPLTTAQWRQVEQALAAAALFRAKLLAGEMPDEIEEVFAACGTPLFPRSANDLDMSCSCPDWGMPCKHIAATCYVLAEAFDTDPFLMLAWRGRVRADLLAALRRVAAPDVAAVQEANAGPQAAAGDVAARPVIDITGPPLADCLHGVDGPDGVAEFWSPGLSPARLRARPVVGTAAPDVLLRTFEPPKVRIRGRGLAELLAPVYPRLTGTDADGAGSSAGTAAPR